MTVLALGPFDLETHIATGGMGQVWKGKHRSSDLDVAIKVLTGRSSQQSRFRETFQNEARAMSGLSHQNIVQIYDYGEIPRDSEVEAYFGRDCPYLVMEYLIGSLDERPLDGTWADLQSRLKQLLAALAHAHSRGVVHRDLKPGNLLLSKEGQIKLTDFGIAFATDQDDVDLERLRAAGTPEYMAPEQCHGMWRDFGPWTDLYAVGCLAWQMATGDAPFDGETPMVTMLMKLENDPPPFLPLFPVPDAFEEWVLRLLQRSPGERFQRAADASRVLHKMKLADESNLDGHPALQSSDAFVSFGHDTLISGEFAIATSSKHRELLALPPHYEGNASPAVRGDRAPMPSSWRLGTDRDSKPLMDTGLALYSLRQHRLIARTELCEELWEALRQVYTTAEPRVVLLRGVSGSGKSRLVEWLCERAHEVGAAIHLRGLHAPDTGLAHGLPAMLLRHLRCNGLALTELQERIETLLKHQGVDDPEEWQALTQLLAPSSVRSSPMEGPTRHFASQQERHLVLIRHLERMALERTVLLWLDDIEWGYDTLEFVRYLVERQRGAFLIVMTTCEEVLSERPVEKELLRELLENARTKVMEVGPLSNQAHRKLVRGLLYLDPALARKVEERTMGNPLFAIQLVQDWVDRRLLEAGPKGYRLKGGASAELPADLGTVWAKRIERVLEKRPESDGIVLELAAALGREVYDRELQAVCRLADVEPSQGIRSFLLQERLIRPVDSKNDEGPWTFVHGMLREAFERRAASAGRLKKHHMLCATMLRAEGGQLTRLGRHLRFAGELKAALSPLRRSIERHLQDGNFSAAEADFIEWTDIMEGLKLDPNSKLSLESRLMRSRIIMIRGEIEKSLALAKQVEHEAEASGWRRLSVLALFHQAETALAHGQLMDTLELAGRADAYLTGDSESVTRGHAQWLLARARAALGDSEGALEALLAAERYFLEHDEVVSAAQCLLARGRVICQLGRFDEAEDLVNQARSDLRRAGDRTGFAESLNNLGDIARLMGDGDAAEEYYRVARERCEHLGSPHVVVAEVNLAALLTTRLDLTEAKNLLDQVYPKAVERQNNLVLCFAHVIRLNYLALRKEWKNWDMCFDEAENLIEDTGFIDFDVAEYLDRAGNLAFEAGREREARLAWNLALEQWTSMERQDRVETTLALLTKRLN